MSQKFSTRAALSLMVFILVLTPMSPLSETFIGEAKANGASRHIYTFSDGSVENIALYQGGAELALWTKIPREMIVVIQALVILFTGALSLMVRAPLERLFMSIKRADV